MTELLGKPMGLFIGLMIGLQVSEGQLREGPHNSEIYLFSAMDHPYLLSARIFVLCVAVFGQLDLHWLPDKAKWCQTSGDVQGGKGKGGMRKVGQPNGQIIVFRNYCSLSVKFMKKI